MDITGADQGTLNGSISFEGIENLSGAAGNRDTFVVEKTGSISGQLDGGDAGFDTLVVKTWSTGAIPRARCSATGGRYRAWQIEFTGLEPVVIDGVNVGGSNSGLDTTGLSSSFTFTTPGGVDNVTVDSPATGQDRISGTSDGTAFESIFFQERRIGDD